MTNPGNRRRLLDVLLICCMCLTSAQLSVKSTLMLSVGIPGHCRELAISLQNITGISSKRDCTIECGNVANCSAMCFYPQLKTCELFTNKTTLSGTIYNGPSATVTLQVNLDNCAGLTNPYRMLATPENDDDAAYALSLKNTYKYYLGYKAFANGTYRNVYTNKIFDIWASGKWSPSTDRSSLPATRGQYCIYLNQDFLYESNCNDINTAICVTKPCGIVPATTTGNCYIKMI